MGVNSSCSNCCIEKELYFVGRTNAGISDAVEAEQHDRMELVVVLPKQTYAKPVGTIIDMTNVVRKTYKE
jgi:hypothetical protein